jgi:rubrerythrin
LSIFFSGSELVDIAIGIERNGASFYDSLVGPAGSEVTKGVYEYLAGEERKHVKVFQSMLDSVADYRPSEIYTDEYALYLKALVDSAVFSSNKVAQRTAQKVDSEAEAVQIGMGAEKDSILFYSEMRNLVRQPDREVVTRIIEEEKSHLRQLSDLKKSLGTGKNP